jgi:hypothetical protein
MADVMDAYSQPAKETVLVARKFPAERPDARSESWVVGAVMAPHPGESTCGDNWSIRRNRSATWPIVADGLGHGVLAADASSAAVKAFHAGNEISAGRTLESVHLALRATRGAAVAHIDHETRVARYAGIGNIVGVLLGGARPQFMVSHNGTAGLEAHRFQEFDYRVPTDGVVVMHSDGINTSWSTDAYPGLLRRHPSVLYRDASRGHDDACVVVGRYIQE